MMITYINFVHFEHKKGEDCSLKEEFHDKIKIIYSLFLLF